MSRQEALISEFSSQSFGACGIFRPRLWGNGREPADMIMIAGRSMLLFNMTEGKSYFDQLCQHNIDQAHARLVEWHEGLKPIRGANAHRNFELFPGDVDEIVVISVVDGPHAGCIAHPTWQFSDMPKVKAVVSLAGEALANIAELHGGIRDVIQFCEAVALDGEMIAANRAVTMVHSIHHLATAELRSLATTAEPAPSYSILGADARGPLELAHMTLFSVRQQVSTVESVFLQMDWHDVAWFEGHIGSSVAKIEAVPKGEYGMASIFAARTRPPLPLFLIVARHISQARHLLEQAAEQIDIAGSLGIVIYLDLGFGAMLVDGGERASSPLTLDIARLAAD